MVDRINNRHLNKNILETFGLDPTIGQTFYDSDSDSSGFEEAERVDFGGDAASPTWNAGVGAFRRHHTVFVNYPALNLLTSPTEEFLMNKPQSPKERYAPHPLVRDDEVMRHAARDKITDNGFYSVYRCDQDVPNPCVREFTNSDIFIDVEEAIKCHGKTDLSVVMFKDNARPELGPQIRIRRLTRFIWGKIVDYNEQDYTFVLKDFMSMTKIGSTKINPTWFQDLVHLMGVESDRAARFIAFQLEHYATTGTPRKDLLDNYTKFHKSFGAEPRWFEDFDAHLSLIVQEHKTPAYKLAPKCMYCRLKCELDVSLPCSKDHVIHEACLMGICRSTDIVKVACLICNTRIFTNPDRINELKFNVHPDGLFYHDDRYTDWENYEKSCSDLDSTSASTSTFPITVNRTFLSHLWRHVVRESIEPNIPEHLRFDVPDEYTLLESLVEGQFMHLEGVRTTIASLDRWIKRRVYFRFRSDFLKWNLEQALTPDEKRMLARGSHEFMQKIALRRGWYDAYLKNLNRTLQFLSMRCCACSASSSSSSSSEQGQQGNHSVYGYHWHGYRDFYNPRMVEREQEIATTARREIYEWQGSQAGKRMMELFEIEVKKGEGGRSHHGSKDGRKEGRREGKVR